MLFVYCPPERTHFSPHCSTQTLEKLVTHQLNLVNVQIVFYTQNETRMFRKPIEYKLDYKKSSYRMLDHLSDIDLSGWV